MDWIKNNLVPLLFTALGFIADETAMITDFLTDIKAPYWIFTVVKYIGMAWVAIKLYNAKSPKIKNEIEDASLVGGSQVPIGKDEK
jgi:hypothetical protein